MNKIRLPLSLTTLFSFIALLLGTLPARESVREITALPTWQFSPETSTDEPASPPALPGASAKWKAVAIPHVFRQSGLPDNSAGWYRVSFAAISADKGRRFLLELEGAATVKNVYINGTHAGQHKSAYTASVFDLTPGLRFNGANEILVRVSNRDTETKAMLARSTLYFVNGGMFRPARLIKTVGAVHLFPEDGSCGVYLTPANVTAERADLRVRAIVRNPLDHSVTARAVHTVTGPDGVVVARIESEPRTFAAGETAALETTGVVTSPKLWDLGQPHLYTVRTELSAAGNPSDALTETTGFRTFALRDKKFYVNGRETLLRGVNKHAQTEYAWNAISEDELRAEWDWMRDMGVNTVRLAHYPHQRVEYHIADQRGVAVWAENGFAGHEWKGFAPDDVPPTPDGERITREMVRQLWNHPSIVFWSAGNESVAETADRYADIIRETDPSGNRLVTYAVARKEPKRTDFLAYNTYDGWYGARIASFAGNLKNTFISETGGGDWLTHHVPYGTFQWTVDKFEPEEYAGLFTEARLQRVFKDAPDKHPMFLWWNFREFYDRKFKQNRNTKGLVTLAGTPKDLYFLFQAFMRPDFPVVRLADRTHVVRRFAPENGIKAYSNAPSLELFVNGVSQGRLDNGAYVSPPEPDKAKDGTVKLIPGKRVDNVFFWTPNLSPGRHVVEVRAPSGARDQIVIFQGAPDGTLPADPAALVTAVRSSNPASPAYYLDRAVEAQGPVYLDVDGSSDNTFDRLPPELKDATSLVTRRLSDSALKTDLSFTVNSKSKGATVHVLLSTGTHPLITLKPRDAALTAAAEELETALKKAGFCRSSQPVVWRNHDLALTEAALWSRRAAPGESITLPGVTLDYVVLFSTSSKP